MKLYTKLFKSIQIKPFLFLKHKLFISKPKYNINKDFNIMDYVKRKETIQIPIDQKYETIDFTPKKK